MIFARPCLAQSRSQRDRAVANLPTGEGTTGPVMPDVRTPTGSARASAR
jgi:hypothetical protein